MSAGDVSQSAQAARKLSGAQKVAIILLSVGPDVATRLMRAFTPEQTRLVARAVSDLGTVPKAVLDAVIESFIESLERGADLEGSAENAARLLSGVMPSEQVEELMTDIKGKSGRLVWSKLAKIAPASLARYLAQEHPQVSALVLSKTAPACAAAALGQFPGGLRNEVVRRMLAIKQVAEPAIAMLEEVLNDDLLCKAAQGSGPGTHARLAALLNQLERAHMDDVLGNLAETRPKEAKIVRGLLFTFDDIARLTAQARAKLLDQVPMERLIVAVRGADPGLIELMLSCLGGRARRMVEQELQSGAAPPAKEINKARREIADLALSMAEKGLIELNADEEAA